MLDDCYKRIVEHYESCLEEHGDTFRGVDWPNAEDAVTRYQVMLGIMGEEVRPGTSLLDFGCGASHLYEYIIEQKLNNIEYAGLDLSERFVDLSQNKFPSNRYYCCDILADDSTLPTFDYIVMNGVLTEKVDLAQDQMFSFLKDLVQKVFEHANRGIAFNVMSKQVDWERSDLFHLPMDELATYLTANVSRHFVFRHDYGLYEYTAYVYKTAQ